MKQLFITLLSGCVITTYCSAQEISDDNPVTAPRNRGPVRTVSTIAVTFITDDTCNLTIDYKDHKEFVKNKTLRLPLGYHRLFFESLETGKTIRDRSFRLTRDSLTGGAYTYPVTFKQQN